MGQRLQIGAREITNRQGFQIGVGTANRCRTRVTLAVVFDEFEMVYIFLLHFSFHYHSQLLKGQMLEKSGDGGRVVAVKSI